MPSPLIYDAIGRTYGRFRRPDPRIASIVADAIAGAATVVNVGAGPGSYEPAGTRVIAVEPSRAMIAQRPTAAGAIQAVAEHVPCRSGSFDVAIALLTVHHWSDATAGLAEMRRIARRQVVLTWDPVIAQDFWLVRDYLPEVASREAGLATVDAVREGLGRSDVCIVPVPWDCTDGFLGAYWRRPERYLDPGARAAISGLTLLDRNAVARGMRELERDLRGGSWARRYGDLLRLEELDVGYRLVVAGS